MTWTDRDNVPDVLSFFGDTISGRLSVLSADADSFVEIAGFQPGIDTVTSAQVGFSFSGLNGPVDWTFKNGRLLSLTPLNTSYQILGVPLNFQVLGPVSLNGYVDFTLTYQGVGTTPITMTSAFLNVNGNNVPDSGSTALLLSGAGAGLVLLSRRSLAKS